MKKYIKFISVGLISTMLISPFSSYAANGGSLDIFLGKISNLSPFMKDMGVGMLKDSFENGDSGIDNLKNSVDLFITDSHKQQLKEKGYTVDDLKNEIDNFKSWSKEDKDSLIKHLEDGNSNGIAEVIKKNKQDSKSDETSSSGSSSSDKKDTDKEQTNNGDSNNTNNNSSGNNSTENNNKQDNKKNITFKDVSNHWGKESIEFLAGKDIVKGKSTDAFDPEGKITRGEFTSLIVRLFNLQSKNQDAIKFKDVEKAKWYYESIKAAIDNGIVSGVDENTFKPNSNISREEMAVIVIRALEKNGGISKFTETSNSIETFKDKSNMSSWAKDSMGKSVKYGLLNGKGNNNLAPKDNTTRAESASLIYRIYTNINK